MVDINFAALIMGNEETPEDGVVHDEVEIEDFEYDPEADTFTYPCPCGDEFVVLRVSLKQLSSKYEISQHYVTTLTLAIL